MKKINEWLKKCKISKNKKIVITIILIIVILVSIFILMKNSNIIENARIKTAKVYWDTKIDSISGGVGNPGGQSSNDSVDQTAHGTGGLLIIYTTELLNNCKITANGTSPETASWGINKMVRCSFRSRLY